MLPYLSKLCTALTTSMIGDGRSVSIKVVGKGGNATCREAESLGLIATELVMNALKHAFVTDKIDGRIVIAYDVEGTNWKLRSPTMGPAGRTASLHSQKPDSEPVS